MGVEMRIRPGVIVGVILVALVAHVVRAQKQDGARNPAGACPTYNRDLAGTRYSRLTQINTTNVSTLVQAWSYRLRPEPGRSVPAIDRPASAVESLWEGTPVVG